MTETGVTLCDYDALDRVSHMQGWRTDNNCVDLRGHRHSKPVRYSYTSLGFLDMVLAISSKDSAIF